MVKLFSTTKIDPDILFALAWKKPDSINVVITESDDGYFAKVVSLEGNVVTQAKTGQELFEMVNDAVYEYLDIPEQYREKLGYFMPSGEAREKFSITIPKKYLNKKIGLASQ